MNILFLSELFHPHGGGAELATYLYAKLLSEAKFNVVVVTNRFTGESEFSKNEGFTVYRLPLLKKRESIKYSILQRFDVLFSSFMRKWMKWADVVYVPRFWFSAILLAKSYGKPVITHLHDYVPICPLAVLYDSKKDEICKKEEACSPRCIYMYESKRRSVAKAAGSTFLNLAVWPFLRRFVECSDAVVCVSRAQRDLMVKYAPSLRDKVRVIYNPLPQLSSVELNGDDFGYFGGSSYLKGFHVLLKAMRLRKSRGFKSVAVHATKFSNVNRRFAGLLGDLGFAVYGKLDNDAYDRVYRNVRAVVVPSIWHEPLPYVVSEAILRGRIVIASAVGGIPEQTQGYKGAFLFEQGNHNQLIESIETIRNLNRETAIDLSISSRDIFTRKFDNREVLRSFATLCNTLIIKH